MSTLELLSTRSVASGAKSRLRVDMRPLGVTFLIAPTKKRKYLRLIRSLLRLSTRHFR